MTWLRFNYALLVVFGLLGLPGFTVWRESIVWVNVQSYLALILGVMGVIAGARAEEKAKEASDGD